MPDAFPSRRLCARLKVVNPRSAGIDIGSLFHVVAIFTELDDEQVRKFLSCTSEPNRIVEWLLAQYRDGADGVDRSLLVPFIRNTCGSRHGGLLCHCSTRQKCARQKDLYQ
jgi:hypothetical protein